MRPDCRLLLSTLVPLCALAGAATAQETTGTISGVVTDEQGAVIPGVAIVATHVPTGRTFDFVSTSTGVYRAALLPGGAYTLTFTLPGFQTLTVTGILVSVNDRIEVNGKLKVGGLTETVAVTAARSLIQSTSAVQQLVGAKQVQELPLNNRNFVQLATLAPGVSSDLSDEVGVGLTSTVSISVNGGRRNARQLAGRRRIQRRRRLEHHAAVDADARVDRRIQDHHQQLRRRVAAKRRRRRQRRDQVRGPTVQAAAPTSSSATTRSMPTRASASRAPIPQVRDNPPRLDYKNFGFTIGGPARVARQAVLLLVAGMAADQRAPTSRTTNVPDPAWLTDPANANYVAPADRDPNAVRLLTRIPAPNTGTGRHSQRRRRTSTTRGRRWCASTTTSSRVAVHRPLHPRPERDRGGQAACSRASTIPERRHDRHRRAWAGDVARRSQTIFGGNALNEFSVPVLEQQHQLDQSRRHARHPRRLRLGQSRRCSPRTPPTAFRSLADCRPGDDWRRADLRHRVPQPLDHRQLHVAARQPRAEVRRARDLRAEERECGQRHPGQLLVRRRRRPHGVPGLPDRQP